jgi:hypothetical protein
MGANPVSVGDNYSMPLNSKVYMLSAPPSPGIVQVDNASVIESPPLANAVAPNTNNSPSVGATASAATEMWLPNSTAVSISIASPAVVALAGHGLVDAQQIMFATTGTLPAGITPMVPYYVRQPTTDTFTLVFNSSIVNTSGSQSGTHTILYRTI